MSYDKVQVGNRIRGSRLEKGWTQERLAACLLYTSFSPFSPLRGYDEQLAAEKQRTERVTKRILTEEEMSALSDRLMQVTKGMIITVRYFKEDTAHPEVPAVGNYITLTGKADRIDPVFRTLQVGDTVVPFEDLVEISGEGIMEIDQYLGISG